MMQLTSPSSILQRWVKYAKHEMAPWYQLYQKFILPKTSFNEFEGISYQSLPGSSWRAIPAYLSSLNVSFMHLACNNELLPKISWLCHLKKHSESPKPLSLSKRYHHLPIAGGGERGWRLWVKFLLWPWNFANLFIRQNDDISHCW